MSDYCLALILWHLLSNQRGKKMLSPFCVAVGVFTSQNTVRKPQEANSMAHSDGVAPFFLH